MIIRRGNVVSHAIATDWGLGKIVEVTDTRATIEFADGTVRKIASSHYASLLLADPAFFMPAPPVVAEAKARPTPKAKAAPKEKAIPKAKKAKSPVL